MLDQLRIYFIEENNLNIHNYKSYSDLSGLTVEQLWDHANEYGYKEQRQIFNDCYYNRLFYDYYLSDYRKIVLSNNPQFDWKVYNINSEYYALIDYISKCELSYNETTDISYTNPHYSLIAECPNYDYLKFPFAYGSGQWSSGLFGIIIPCKSIMKRGYFMYLYDSASDYQSSDLLEEYDFNNEKVKIRLDLYINGTQSEYYIEETIDPSKNMLGALFKKKNINGPTIEVDYNNIVLEENSVISWFCSELLGKNVDGEYTNYPYNPSRNRFIMILEPYNTRFFSNGELLDVLKNEIDVIKTEVDLNEHNISLKQNKLIVGNNIEIVDNIISVVGVSGVESNLFLVNELRNEIELSLNELNTNLQQNTITSSTDISLNDLHVLGDFTVDGSFNIQNVIQNDITINNTILVSSQLDISNQGTGPALKVTQLGNGTEKHVALFNAGEEGDSLLIDSSGNTTIYKSLEVIGDVSMNNNLNVSGTFNSSIMTTGTINASIGNFTNVSSSGLVVNGNVRLDTTTKKFDTMVVRRVAPPPVGQTHRIVFNELQCWVNGSNIMVQNSLNGYFANWEVDKDIEIPPLFFNNEFKSVDKVYNNILESDSDFGTHSANDASTAMIIKNIPLTTIDDIQAIVLYSRFNDVRTIGLVIELYNSVNDPSLNTDLATTNTIDTFSLRYRFDYPSISSYTSFVSSGSTTNIIDSSNALTQYAKIRPIEMNGDVSMNNNLTIGDSLSVVNNISHINDFAHFVASGQDASGTEYILQNFNNSSLNGNAISIGSTGGTTNNDLFVAQKSGYFKINATFNYFNTNQSQRIAIRTRLFKNNVYQDANEGFCYTRMTEGRFGSNVINSIIQLNAGDSITSRATMSLTSQTAFVNDMTGSLNVLSASVVVEYIGS